MNTKKLFRGLLILIFLSNSINSELLSNDINKDKKSIDRSFIEYSHSFIVLNNYNKNNLLNQYNDLFIYAEPSFAKSEEASNKSPWLAFFLSYAFPGGGQWYNGDYTKALMIEGIAAIGLGLFFTAISSINYDSESNPNSISVIGYSGAAIIGIGWLWGMIDAPITANKINERNAQQKSSEIVSYTAKNYTFSLNYNKYLSNYMLNVNFIF